MADDFSICFVSNQFLSFCNIVGSGFHCIFVRFLLCPSKSLSALHPIGALLYEILAGKKSLTKHWFLIVQYANAFVLGKV